MPRVRWGARYQSRKGVGFLSRERVNENRIVTERFSNPDTQRRYRAHWPGEPALFAQYEEVGQCGGCAYFVPFNSDWGLCRNTASRHVTETAFEHFTCEALVEEGWGAHTFTAVRPPERDKTDDAKSASRAAS